MKEQIKTPEKELNKMEKRKLSDAEFKTLVIGMLKELIGYFNSIKKTQAEMNIKLNEIKKNSQGTKSRVDEAENQINDLENREEKKHSIRKTRRKKNKKNKDRLRNFWGNFKHTDT